MKVGLFLSRAHLIKCISLLSLVLVASSTYLSYKKVELVSVYDGDTFTVNLPCGDPLFCKKIPVRIKGIDAPEIRGACRQEKNLAIEARDYLRAFLHNKDILLTDCERDKYFRIACHAYANEQSVSATLIKASLARYYSKSSKKSNWCLDY